MGQPRVSWLTRPSVALGLCVLLALVAYAPALGNGFYNDDALFLNHAQRVLEHPSVLFTERPLNFLRPVWGAWITAQRALFGLEPAGYYAVGILLHGLVGFLVWRLGRRMLDDPIAALVGASAFVVFYVQAEASLWIAAQNSSLVAGLAVLSVLCHLRAVESGRAAHGLLTALVLLATLLTKEPGLFALAWMALAEVAQHGPRSFISRSGMLRWAVLLAVAAIYLLNNPMVTGAFAGGEALRLTEIRAAMGFVTLERVVGASAWLFSPFAHQAADLRVLWGVLVLGGAILLVAWLRGDRLVPALLSVLILLVGMVATCMTRSQQPSGSRLYYFPTVGAALLIASVAAAVRAPDPRRLAVAGARRALRAAGVLLLAGYLVLQVRAIHDLNARDYRLISRLQLRTVEQLGPYIPKRGGSDLVLLEPWIDNVLHLREFLWLYHGVWRSRVTRERVGRRAGAAWLSQQRAFDPGVVILDWSDVDGLVPAVAMPSMRNSVQGKPRTADTGVRLSTVSVLRIAPPQG